MSSTYCSYREKRIELFSCHVLFFKRSLKYSLYKAFFVFMLFGCVRFCWSFTKYFFHYFPVLNNKPFSLKNCNFVVHDNPSICHEILASKPNEILNIYITFEVYKRFNFYRYLHFLKTICFKRPLRRISKISPDHQINTL